MVAESLRPGINISDLARRCGVNAGLLQTWRRKARQESAVFIPLHVEGPAGRANGRSGGGCGATIIPCRAASCPAGDRERRRADPLLRSGGCRGVAPCAHAFRATRVILGVRPRRRRELSVVEVEAGVATRPEAQRGDGAAAGGPRLLRDRAVARSRIDRDDADLPARASRTQGGSIGQAQAIPGWKPNPLPTQRPFACLPSSLSDSGFSGQLRWPFRRTNAGAGSPVGS